MSQRSVAFVLFDFAMFQIFVAATWDGFVNVDCHNVVGLNGCGRRLMEQTLSIVRPGEFLRLLTQHRRPFREGISDFRKGGNFVSRPLAQKRIAGIQTNEALGCNPTGGFNTNSP